MTEEIVKVICAKGASLPTYQTQGSSGADICAFLEEDIVIEPLSRHLIPTGLFMQVPEGYEVQIRPRSGLAIKSGITCLNTPGTIDSDYRGEVKIILFNASKEAFTVRSGDRIAQMVLSRYERASFLLTDTLDSTLRGSSGFGSSGV